ncbi:hypothetical protein C8R44DRAFT_901273 [Mycena epipterygia]|nr:hypothetical protein C8R44DRAFT_901273 [Mycena epipterygia]
MRHKTAIPSGFRPAPKPKRTPISEMSLRELQDLHSTNTRLLASPYGQSWMGRVTAEQAAVEGRLVELVGMDTIATGLKNSTIKGEDDMIVDPPPEPYTSPTLEAKRKALSKFGPANDGTVIGALMQSHSTGTDRHAADKERQDRLLEKRRRMGMSIPGEQLTRQQREARMWAFMNHKPSESDT